MGTAASMVLDPTDTTLDSMATVDTLPTPTPMAMDTQPLTAMDLTGSTSVMLSQRLMPTMLVFTDMATQPTDTLDTPPDTLDTPLLDTDTHILMADTSIKFLKKLVCTPCLLFHRTLKRHSFSLLS